MSITRGDFLRSLGKSLPGMVASTGVATAAEALIRRVAQATPAPAPEPVKPAAIVPFFERGPAEGKRIALTFDDGPVPGVTEILLDELGKRKIRATFFMIGNLVAAAPDLARRVLAEGHELGNHTFTHPKLTELSEKDAEDEVEKTEKIFAELLSHKADWFRPPFGAFRQNQAALATSRNLSVALWSVDSGDWRIPGEAQIVQNILTQVQRGSIILCHELSGTAGCLGEILDGLSARDFKFVTVSELLSTRSA